MIHPPSAQLLRWGADFGPLTLGGQWWRLLTSAFVHIGIIHLLLNMIGLWTIGGLGERVYGRVNFVAIYLVSATAGSIASVAWKPFGISAGASGAIFGLAGALIVSFYKGELPFPQKTIKLTLLSLLAFAGYSIGIGIVEGRVDNVAHVAGFATGLLLGFCLSRISIHRRVWTIAVLVLVVASVAVGRARGYVVHLERGRVALASRKFDPAVAELSTAAREDSRSAEIWVLLGDAYFGKGDFGRAETAYRRGLELAPAANRIRYQIGSTLLMQKRLPDALAIFQDLAKREPRSATPVTNIGMIALMSGQYDTALGAFRRAIELDPNRAQPYRNFGILALRLGRYDDAIQGLLRYLQFAPKDYAAQLGLAKAYEAKGLFAQAQAAYERAAKLAPKK